MDATLQAFLKYLKVERNYSDHTILAYRESLTDFEDFVTALYGSFDPLCPNLNNARAWMVDMGKRHYAITTIKLHLCALKSYCKYLRREGKIDSNPLSLLPSPQVPKPLPVWVRKDEMNAIIDETDFGDDFEGVRDRLFIVMLYSTGMRRAEIIGLTDAEIDMAARTILITGKGNKQRLVPFGQELFDLIHIYLNAREQEIHGKTERFFIDAKGNAISRQKADAIASKYLSQISSLPKHGTHVFRHSFATNMLAEGADLMAVKELLGHASLNSTEVYTHLTPQELLQNYRKAHPRSKD